MSTLHLTRGLPGSGKSTFARAWTAEDPASRLRVNRDDVRAMVHATYSGRATEDATTTVAHSAIRTALRNGRDVIVDDTNLNAGIVRSLLKLAEQTGAGVEFHDFPISPADAIARDAERAANGGRSVGAEVIEKMQLRYLAQHKGAMPAVPALTPRPTFKPYTRISGTPKAVIVDIDGTLLYRQWEAERLGPVRAVVKHARQISPSPSMTCYVADVERALGLDAPTPHKLGGSEGTAP